MLEALPVYRKVKELRSYMLPILAKMPRSLRYTVVDRIVGELFDVVRILAELSLERDKTAKMEKIGRVLIEMDILNDDVEFLVESEGISYGQSEHMILLIDEIGEQMGAWNKYLSASADNSGCQDSTPKG